MKRAGKLVLGALLLAIAVQAAAQSQPEQVTFKSGDVEIHGLIWKPNGPGPFPVVIWNHGSEKNTQVQNTLAAFYTSHFFVFFTPDRRGHGASPGNYVMDEIRHLPPAVRGRRMVEMQESELQDVMAAVSFAKKQNYIDPMRIAVSGCSFGGIQTLLAGEQEAGIRALVAFAPGAKSWDGTPAIQERLKKAVDNAKAPIFILQAQNDFNLAPTRELTKEAEKKHVNMRSKIYPAVGKTAQDGHWQFCTQSTDLWGQDVLSFLAENMREPG